MTTDRWFNGRKAASRDGDQSP